MLGKTDVRKPATHMGDAGVLAAPLWIELPANGLAKAAELVPLVLIWETQMKYFSPSLSLAPFSPGC